MVWHVIVEVCHGRGKAWHGMVWQGYSMAWHAMIGYMDSMSW